MWEVIFYLIAIFPVAYNNYLRNENYKLSTRIINFSISFILLIYFASEFRKDLWDLIENGTSCFVLQSDIGISEWFHVVVSILYFLMCFYIAVLSIQLGIKKARARNLLQKSIPYVGILLVNYDAMFFMKTDTSLIGRFFYSCLIVSLAWLPILILLSFLLRTNSMKEMYAEK
jgi:hypothetical protein